MRVPGLFLFRTFSLGARSGRMRAITPHALNLARANSLYGDS